MIRSLKRTADSVCDTAVAAGPNRLAPPSPTYPPLILKGLIVWVSEQETVTRFFQRVADSNLRGCGASRWGWRTCQCGVAVSWVA